MESFLWGAATSSHQIEGGNRFNDWWQWELEGNIERGERSGPATDHWNRWKEDLRLAKEMGLTSYRFSIEWSRLEPEEGNWNEEAFQWYDELLAECERLSLVPMVTLHHFTLPLWLAERGGFTAENAPGRFLGYVRQVAKRLGARVPLWCTLNEPNSLVIGGYLGAFMPPARHQPRLVSRASRNLLMAHVLAYDELHRIRERKGPWRDWPLRVGIAHNMIDFIPRRPYSFVERWLTSIFRRWYNRAWPDAVTGRRQHFGAFGLIPQPPQVWEARRRRTCDFLGINYYMKVYVCFGPQKEATAFVPSKTIPVGVVFSRAGDRVSDLGWAFHPSGLGRMIRFMSRYGVPLYITENGIADAADQLRPQYLREHLAEVARAIARGADVRGYYHWSLLDNFEWIKGFAPRFGLYGVDYENFQRIPRASVHCYREIIRASGETPGVVPTEASVNCQDSVSAARQS